jgi:predicted helicase
VQVSEKDKAIQAYYAELTRYEAQRVEHEGALRTAFSNLLSHYAQQVNWTLIPELTLAGGARPDGVLRDHSLFYRGYWEAKDTRDDLDAEINKKIARGYPLDNTIFEDTRAAVLYQGKRRVMTADLRVPRQLADLLQTFFTYEEAEIEAFERAIEVFRERIPDLARELMRLIESVRGAGAFESAFQTFYTLCQGAIDPKISEAAVEEMLVQHLLTERLIRVIFNNPDFTRRNVIAQEIETVIAALTARSFNRNEFLRDLDRYYAAVEQAAPLASGGAEAWAERQAFLNMVYERFFQGYSIRQADTHGIVYTPQEIVDFMVASVDEVLKREFGMENGLGEPGVKILDPATGTGNFIVNILRRIPARHLRQKYTEDLFCNEIMLLPYYIACLNIEHEYYARTGVYEPFAGACFADTLDMAESRQMSMFSEPNSERVQAEKDASIMVVIGNPPYNVGQVSANDNNKNRSYEVIDGRIRETYAKDSRATLKNKLSDPYVKFFRWATDRLQGRDGIVCFVSNNSFVDQLTFDGMRKHLLQDFTAIYHLDLHGNVRKNPRLSGTTHNVFGIQVGVGITIAIHRASSETRGLYYYRVPEDWRRREKLAFLATKGSAAAVEWQELIPDEQFNWLTEGMRSEYQSFLPLGTKEAREGLDGAGESLFTLYSPGVNTSRDDWVYDFSTTHLVTKMRMLIRNYNSEVTRWITEGMGQNIDSFVNNDPRFVKWTDRLKDTLQQKKLLGFDESRVRQGLYRPFCRQFLYFDHLMNQRRYQQHRLFPNSASEAENIAICVSGIGSEKPFMALVTNLINDYHLVGAGANSQTFPYYTYDEDGTNRRENITDWALARFQAAYGPEVTKRDIFHYVYGLLHHPAYRERYAANLRRELPRLPLLEGAAAFRRCAEIGERLMALHLGYEDAALYPLRWVEHPDASADGRVTFHVKKMKLSPNRDAVIVNETLTLEGVPPECFEYRLGNRSALEWVIDQYQISEDKRSGIISDPNRPDDPQYIANLVCRVVTVSVETVKRTRALSTEIMLAEPVAAGERARG